MWRWRIAPCNGKLRINCRIINLSNDLTARDASSSKMNQVKIFVSDFLYNNIDCAPASAVNEVKNSKELLYQLDMLEDLLVLIKED